VNQREWHCIAFLFRDVPLSIYSLYLLMPVSAINSNWRAADERRRGADGTAAWCRRLSNGWCYSSQLARWVSPCSLGGGTLCI